VSELIHGRCCVDDGHTASRADLGAPGARDEGECPSLGTSRAQRWPPELCSFASNATVPPRRRGRRSDRRGVVRGDGRLVPAQLRLRCLRVRDLRRVPPCHQGAARRIRRARVRRSDVQPARHRPRHRGRFRGEDRGDPLDCRCQTRSAVAARKLGIIQADIAVALSLSMTQKAIGFDRRMPDVDVDALDYEPTGTLPIGVEGAERYGGARNRQQSRRPLHDSDPS